MTTKHRSMTPGTKVAYTGKFLKSCGPFTRRAGQEKFIVQECKCKPCREGRWVAVDRPARYTDPTHPDFDAAHTEELRAELGHTFQHIGTDCLYVVGQLDHRNAS